MSVIRGSFGDHNSYGFGPCGHMMPYPGCPKCPGRFEPLMTKRPIPCPECVYVGDLDDPPAPYGPYVPSYACAHDDARYLHP